MLVRLDIRNFALIDRASLHTGPGFSVISGETGAGKSLLIGAIEAVMGNRVSKETVQTGREQAVVEACFTDVRRHLPPELDEELFPAGSEQPDELILSREIEAGGRTWCRINGRLVPLSQLRQVGSCLMDIHGQNQNQKMFNVQFHGVLLDRFGGEEVAAPLQDYRTVWSQRQALQAELSGFGRSAVERERDLDLLRYQAEEIRRAAPREQEDRKLQKHRDLQENAERIARQLGEAMDLLEGKGELGGALAAVSGAVSAVEKTLDVQPAAAAAYETLATCQDLLHEALSELRRVSEAVEYNPQLLEKIDARLDVLHRLKKKYGPQLRDVLRFAAAAEERIRLLEDSEARIEALSEQLERTEGALAAAADRLTAARTAAGERLGQAICRELSTLGMKDARFVVRLQPKSFQADGADAVEFLLSTNPGEPVRRLAKIASGGEAARIMLAIKLILAAEDETPLLIFDEVDAGISGQTAELVGQKLLELSRSAQVFCVTHTAQIAALADRHMLIEKESDGVRTVTDIRELDEEGRVQEVARLLSGVTAAAQARQLAQTMRAAKKDRQHERQVTAQ